MKRINALLVFMMFSAFSGKAQELSFDFAYSYLQAKTWNQAVQSYNFSRPFLEEKQPLLRHGPGFGMHIIWPKEQKLNHGISAVYNSLLSTAENPNYNISVKAKFLDIGYLARFKNKPSEMNGWSWEVRADLKSTMLSRHLNDEIVKIENDDEETLLRTFGAGFQLEARLGHTSGFGRRQAWTKFIGVYYSPYTWAYRSELVFNESSTGLKSSTSFYGFRAGFSFPIYWKTNRKASINE